MQYMMEAYGAIQGYGQPYRQPPLPLWTWCLLKRKGPLLEYNEGNELTFHERRPFMHRGDSYPFLIDRVLIDRRI